MTTADGSILGTTKIVDNGPSAIRWDMVLMGDGYQPDQMDQYEADVQRFVDALFATPPFDEMRPAINVDRVDVPSTDSGADDPTACGGSGATARTYFDGPLPGRLGASWWLSEVLQAYLFQALQAPDGTPHPRMLRLVGVLPQLSVEVQYSLGHFRDKP